jgi:hypothetical protein
MAAMELGNHHWQEQDLVVHELGSQVASLELPRILLKRLCAVSQDSTFQAYHPLSNYGCHFGSLPLPEMPRSHDPKEIRKPIEKLNASLIQWRDGTHIFIAARRVALPMEQMLPRRKGTAKK